MVEKVVVAVDGGPASNAAISWVVDRGQSVRIQVEIVTVARRDDIPGGKEVDYRTPAEQAVFSAFGSIRSALPNAVINTRILQGMPEQELILASYHADLLVVGSARTGGMPAALYSTLPLKIAGHSSCPTVVVPIGWQPNADSIVVGWSDDPTSDGALDFAASEAARLDRTLVVVHTWRLPTLSPMAGSSDASTIDELGQAHHAMLAEAVARIRQANPDLRVGSETQIGEAGSAIAQAAAHSSLVVVGSHGRGPMAGLFLGSVSHALLMALPAPVVVLPARKVPVDVYPELVDEQI